MNIGKLNKKIQIWGKKEGETTNRLKEKGLIDDVLAAPFASIVPRTGSLMSGRSADTILSKTTHIIRIRCNSFPDLSIKNWIIYKNHRFNIDYVLNPEFLDEFLDAYVTEEV